jgi:hypothetical protein
VLVLVKFLIYVMQITLLVLKAPQVLKVIMDQLVDPVVQVLKVSKVQPDRWERPQRLQRVFKDRWVLLEMLH